jgi:hypothetical protein
MSRGHRTRDHIEATQQLIEHRFQRIANESGIQISELVRRELVETIIPADRSYLS